MGICDDALWCPMEGSPQTVPRGLERKVGRKLRRSPPQVRTSLIVSAVRRTEEFHSRARLVSCLTFFLSTLASYAPWII